MRTRDTNTAQRQPAAAVGTQQLRRTTRGTLQAAIDQSPRVLAQRRALQMAYGSAFQHRADEPEDESLQQGHFEAAPVQRTIGPLGRGGPTAASAGTILAPVNKTGMPNQLKAGIEALSGMDVSDVRVHRNSSRPAQLNALAYAQGNEIHLGPGQERHLPHEAWHVVQQRQGRVLATKQIAGTDVNDSPALEEEADVMGTRALQASVASPRGMQAELPLQLVAQLTIAEAIQSVIPKAPGTAAIAADLEREAIALGIAEAEVNAAKVKEIATSFGYTDAYAQRLANKNPFAVTDIEDETKVDGDKVESFKFNATIRDKGEAVASRHQLNFENAFSSENQWKMVYNARNPALSTFRAPDVTDVQARLRYELGAESPAGRLATIFRENVVSVNGQQWYADKTPPIDAPLSATHLDSFLTQTDNGKSSAATAAKYGKTITAGTIERYASDGFSVKLTCT